MQRRLMTRSLVTLAAIGCTAYLMFPVQSGHFTFTSVQQDAHTLTIGSVPRSSPLQRGDRLDLREQDLATRAALSLDAPPGQSFTLTVSRDGRVYEVPVTTTAPLSTPYNFLNALFLALLLGLGLVTLWWGRDWAAWGLSLFALGNILNTFLHLLPLPPVTAWGVGLVNWTAVASLTTVGLYLASLTIAGPSVTRRARLYFHSILAASIAASAILITTASIRFIVFGDAGLEQSGWSFVFFAVSIFVPLALLLAAYPRADSQRRLRLRWIIWSVALFVGALAWNNLRNVNDIFSLSGLPEQIAWWFVLICGTVGLLYGVLRKRVVAMSFAVNRALVYGLIVAFVVGVFAVLAAIMENTAIGRDAGLALTVGISLGIGLVLEALRDRINSVVERLFFRRMYEAEEALRRFAHQCAYIERPDRLLAETEEEIHRHIQPRSSAFYESSETGYVRVRQRGEPIYPERIETDDRAFVAMRADRIEIELGEVSSALGSEGYVFPMAVRGVLRGALACGARSEEYTRDERKLIAEVAHQVGIALHALRARDNEALVKEIASGLLDPSTARKRARELHAAWATDA